MEKSWRALGFVVDTKEWVRPWYRNWPGKSICVLEPVQSVQHQLRRSPTAITKSEQQYTVINSAFVSVVSHSFYQLLAEESTYELFYSQPQQSGRL